MPSKLIQKMHGGLGAADYAVSVYGDADSQHAGANGAIAMNNPVAAAPVTGGRRRRGSRKSARKSVRGGRRNRYNKSRRSRK